MRLNAEYANHSSISQVPPGNHLHLQQDSTTALVSSMTFLEQASVLRNRPAMWPRMQLDIKFYEFSKVLDCLFAVTAYLHRAALVTLSSLLILAGWDVETTTISHDQDAIRFPRPPASFTGAPAYAGQNSF
jgi:hypothetical protein